MKNIEELDCGGAGITFRAFLNIKNKTDKPNKAYKNKKINIFIKPILKTLKYTSKMQKHNLQR